MNQKTTNEKIPSTAAGTYVQGFGAGAGGYGGRGGVGKYPHESFDLDLMMPPDIASIDSDISKILFYKFHRQA
jgi:hypothetical protein